ncbi:hypothetical protein, partial [Brevibacillus aydinogluensis]|uniref:hypothetical protein n=1 Tax=Brevibacillus aydinogluensis TaxID=927786 RepID=UPI0028934137
TAPPLPPNQQKIAGWVNSKPAMVGQNKVGVDKHEEHSLNQWRLLEHLNNSIAVLPDSHLFFLESAIGLSLGSH